MIPSNEGLRSDVVVYLGEEYQLEKETIDWLFRQKNYNLELQTKYGKQIFGLTSAEDIPEDVYELRTKGVTGIDFFANYLASTCSPISDLVLSQRPLPVGTRVFRADINCRVIKYSKPSKLSLLGPPNAEFNAFLSIVTCEKRIEPLARFYLLQRRYGVSYLYDHYELANEVTNLRTRTRKPEGYVKRGQTDFVIDVIMNGDTANSNGLVEYDTILYSVPIELTVQKRDDI